MEHQKPEDRADHHAEQPLSDNTTPISPDTDHDDATPYASSADMGYTLNPSELSPLPTLPELSNNTQQNPADTIREQRNRHKLFLRHLARKHMRTHRAQTQSKLKRVWLTGFNICTILLVIVLILAGIGAYATYRFYTDSTTHYQKKILSLRELTVHDNLRIYDRHGVILSQLTDQGFHTSVALKNIAPHLINATVSTEDKNFWENDGIDVFRILQAAIQDLEHGRVIAGGSTITQQLIKNLVVGNQTSLVRKLQEVALTPEINALYDKNDIMEMYLNTIYYGRQAYGIDAAAMMYFNLIDHPGKPASAQLDLAQSAMLAGIPSSPAQYDPNAHPQANFNRFVTVLGQMTNEGYITQTQAQHAIQEAKQPHFIKNSSSLLKSSANLRDRAPHFTQYVVQQLEQQTHMTQQQLALSGLKVYTTLDIKLQDKIQTIMQEHVRELYGHNVSNAAEVLMDNRTGAIRSLLGSIDYDNTAIDGQFNVATMGYRQPGSSFKPYVYATALGQGYSPAQAIDDAPLTIMMPKGSHPATYSPKNYDQKYHGQMTLRCALQNSLNIPAVKALQHIGIDNSLRTAKAMGTVHTKGEAGYSMVLGGLDVNLLEHTTGFGTFANGGKRIEPYAIEKVVSTYNHEQTFIHKNVVGKQVISPQVDYMMTDILSDNESRIPEFYDCNPLQLYSNSQQSCYAGNRGQVRPAATKTGTTDDFRDNWTMGYTTDFVMGVWVGNDNNAPMVNVTGVQGAAPIWHDSMLEAERDHPIHDFPKPGGLERGEITYPNGVRTTDWYLPGHRPTFSNLFTAQTTGYISHSHHHHHHADTVTGQPYCHNFSFAFPAPTSNDPNRGWW
jgi:membrane peptidoglycan carboxypeptidase